MVLPGQFPRESRYVRAHRRNEYAVGKTDGGPTCGDPNANVLPRAGADHGLSNFLPRAGADYGLSNFLPRAGADYGLSNFLPRAGADYGFPNFLPRAGADYGFPNCLADRECIDRRAPTIRN